MYFLNKTYSTHVQHMALGECHHGMSSWEKKKSCYSRSTLALPDSVQTGHNTHNTVCCIQEKCPVKMAALSVVLSKYVTIL